MGAFTSIFDQEIIDKDLEADQIQAGQSEVETGLVFHRHPISNIVADTPRKMDLKKRLADLKVEDEKLARETAKLRKELEQVKKLKEEEVKAREAWHQQIKNASTLKFKLYEDGEQVLVDKEKDMFEEIARHEALMPLLAAHAIVRIEAATALL
jgi:regulator of replication initiation timing